jgi:hypothetical protein
MTMHLMHAGFTTTNTQLRKTKKTPAQVKAQQEHEAWLRKQGVHTDQLAQKPTKKSGSFRDTVKPVQPGVDCSNGFAPGGAKKSVFDSEWQRLYEDDPDMAERERMALVRAEQKKSRVMSLYNKGGFQVASENEDMTKVGSLSRRG